MPFDLGDLERIRVRVGMGTKSLREMSDTQFTAWLRGQGARGNIGVIKVRPGELMIPIEERLRVLNDLDRSGFYIQNVMGSPADGSSTVDRARLEATLAHLDVVRDHLEDVSAAVNELGELDPRVNMRASVHGLMELAELLRGAFLHALNETSEASRQKSADF